MLVNCLVDLLNFRNFASENQNKYIIEKKVNHIIIYI